MGMSYYPSEWDEELRRKWEELGAGLQGIWVGLFLLGIAALAAYWWFTKDRG